MDTAPNAAMHAAMTVRRLNEIMVPPFMKVKETMSA
jgi:hypothetical protein